METRKCAHEGCDEIIVIGPKNEHQKYHSRACGEASRKRWLRPERQRYMKEYLVGYVRVETEEPVKARENARKSA